MFVFLLFLALGFVSSLLIIWMLVDSARAKQWLWFVLILFAGLIPAIIYYFVVRRQRQA